MLLEVASNDRRPWGASWATAHTEQVANTLLVAAARQNATATANVLNSTSADYLAPAVAKQDSTGRTALSIALHGGDEVTACLLLAAGATAGEISDALRPALDKSQQLLSAYKSEAAAATAADSASAVDSASATDADDSEPKVIHVVDAPDDDQDDTDDSGDDQDAIPQFMSVRKTREIYKRQQMLRASRKKSALLRAAPAAVAVKPAQKSMMSMFAKKRSTVAKPKTITKKSLSSLLGASR
mmetsp:Transcript_7394/g.10818  ORF Transcript_7394/g.10818 Transcript_7394/m.10818 type:complete len:242 (+) Transcript_7394:21-746(+)